MPISEKLERESSGFRRVLAVFLVCGLVALVGGCSRQSAKGRDERAKRGRLLAKVDRRQGEPFGTTAPPAARRSLPRRSATPLKAALVTPAETEKAAFEIIRLYREFDPKQFYGRCFGYQSGAFEPRCKPENLPEMLRFFDFVQANGRILKRVGKLKIQIIANILATGHADSVPIRSLRLRRRVFEALAKLAQLYKIRNMPTTANGALACVRAGLWLELLLKMAVNRIKIGKVKLVPELDCQVNPGEGKDRRGVAVAVDVSFTVPPMAKEYRVNYDRWLKASANRTGTRVSGLRVLANK